MSVTTTAANIGAQVAAAYDKIAQFALRSDRVFGQFATTKPGSVTHPGSSVSFIFWDDLAAATSALTDGTDVNAVGLSDSTVVITPAEHGNAVVTTIKLRAQTLLQGFDADVANVVAYNMVDSVDNLARAALDAAGTQVTVDGGNVTDLEIADVITMNKIREQIAVLRGDAVVPVSGADYAVTLHPDVAYDLMIATAGGNWQDLKHAESGPLKSGEIGRFAGAVFLESPRALVQDGGASSTLDAYTTYITGKDALGEVDSISPHVVAGPIVDKLMRNQPLGWYGLFGFGELRSAATRRLVSVSTIGENS